MPKLKCPTETEVAESIESMWRHVDEDYVICHRNAAIWSNKSIEKSEQYSSDSRKRARAILKWIKYTCESKGVRHYVKSIHMIDHSKKPPEVSPFLIVEIWHLDCNWLSVEVKIYAPKEFADVETKVNAGIAAALTVGGVV